MQLKLIYYRIILMRLRKFIILTSFARDGSMIEELVSISISQLGFMRKNLPSVNVSMNIAEFFSVFSDNTRVRVLSALAINDLCVGDLSALLGINQSTLSHQLKLMKDAKILECKRNGKVITYYIINPFINDVMMLGVDNYSRDRGEYNIMD